jgi:ubiquinone biosynthesis protein
VGRSIDPHFNLAGELAPFVEKLVKQRYDPRRMLERTLSDARRVLSAVHDIPLSMGSVLEKLGNNDLRIQLEHQKLDEFVNEFDRSSNRVVVGLITASLIVASALVIRSGLTSPWIALPIFLLSGFLGVWLIFGIMRSGRL